MTQFQFLPLAWLYRLGTSIRNYLYDSGYKTSFEFDRFVLAVGNLSAGGTGKTPMIEYLIRLLDQKYKVATLSRGYGRKTRGFRIASAAENAQTIGDEPYQIHLKHPEIPVTVCEERAVGIPFILAEFPETDVILLDDAFQHRAVKPALNILLTAFDRPFFKDHVLPAGRLRESRKGASRADIIVVTRCPQKASAHYEEEYRRAIAEYAPDVPVFFASVGFNSLEGQSVENGTPVIAFSGIAHPESFIAYVSRSFPLISHERFADHHNFTEREITKLADLAARNGAALLTTEKDFVRLSEGAREKLRKAGPLAYVPIRTEIRNGTEFDRLVVKAIEDFSSRPSEG